MSSTIIIILVAAMLVGSLAWILPSPRERQQMALRQYAAKLGLNIKIVDLATVIDESRAEPTHCIAYGVSRAVPMESNGWQVAREHHGAEVGLAHDGLPTGWYWSAGDVPSVIIKQYLKDTLPTLNNDILAVESTAFNCMIYWKEHGTSEQIEQIATVLKKLIELES